MLNLSILSSPRFLVIGHAPRYGPRDEIVGSYSAVEATAETEAYANYLADKRYYPGGDVEFEIVDTQPRCEWSVEIATAKEEQKQADCELPF